MKIKRIAVGIIVVATGFLLLTDRNALFSGAEKGLTVCGEVLIPSLFPFMALSSFSVNSGLFSGNGKLASFVMRVMFHLPGHCWPCVLFGFMGGYPVGASMISSLYKQQKINKNEAEQLFSFCVNSGPAFVISAVGGAILGSKVAGYIIFFSTVSASFLTGIGFSFTRRNNSIHSISDNALYMNTDDALISAVSSATKAILSVCSWVILYSSVQSIASEYILNKEINNILAVVSEISTGVTAAARLGGIPLVSAGIAFGGLSVMCQLMPYIKKCEIKVGKYLLFRIINSFVAMAIAFVFVKLFPVTVSAVSGEVMVLWSVSAPAGAALIILGAVLVFETAEGKSNTVLDITG